jgi:hypothetical protein
MDGFVRLIMLSVVCCSVNNGFDEHDIPMDVIWLDIEHTDGKRFVYHYILVRLCIW